MPRGGVVERRISSDGEKTSSTGWTCIFNIGDGSSLTLGCFHSDMVDPYGSGCLFIMGETSVKHGGRHAFGIVDGKLAGRKIVEQ